MQTFLLGFAEDESGTTVIEYALVASLISVACIGAMARFGNILFGVYSAINTILSAAF